MRNVPLSFDNKTAGEVHRVTCSYGSIDAIMAWYGAFYAGDEYVVKAGSQIIPQDMNGEKSAGCIDA